MTLQDDMYEFNRLRAENSRLEDENKAKGEEVAKLQNELAMITAGYREEINVCDAYRTMHYFYLPRLVDAYRELFRWAFHDRFTIKRGARKEIEQLKEKLQTRAVELVKCVAALIPLKEENMQLHGKIRDLETNRDELRTALITQGEHSVKQMAEITNLRAALGKKKTSTSKGEA